ncbi:glutamyl-tRNA synthetase [Azospirillum lipoferum]|uniref:Glutamate--tRNA ligase n=1 Tax=Azospirillum lipoferum TaxID=193 RepID=A0A5A9GUY9_AZOLI|nr:MULTISPECIES: glutamate--tRNA ligase [Azospirillum]KAA0598163.1 glutamate--tRNA ligase [Azospirillum lipoferum]MCP1613713.1 glutamyl-tRNA synthetase [Azospirillum lipoferum]MDW5534835.1 glutamate--tRNA ligase [Azospirillum sp. NL1]
MSTAVRFAPSPTGRIHVGNVRLALVNWLFARKTGGSFMFRLDDTDEERSTQEFADAIATDLTWLGLTWDRFARESDRYPRYDEAAAALKAAGRLYPCYETPEELNLKRASLVSQGRPPIYDRAALRLTDEDRARLEGEGRKPHWRFKLNPTPVEWIDLVRGPVRFEGTALSDPVLIREDGRPLYTLTSVVDDADFAITHIIRGEDHVANTAVQIQIFEALDAVVPDFAHLPLLTDAGGQGLSKRLGSLSVGSLRDEDGIEPMAVNSLLAKLGTSDPIEARLTLDELVAEFDLSKVARGTPKFDPEELVRLNARILHLTPFDAVTSRLEALGLSGADAVFWEAVRPNLARLSDAREWWAVTHAPVPPVVEDAGFLAQAAALLPDEPWDLGTWGAWTNAVKGATGRKGKELFLPLRRALTGRDHGPELKNLLPLIGRARSLRRLAGETA